jgi:hypothetical protein
MSLDLKNQGRLGNLERQIHGADAVTSKLISDVIAVGCIRLAALGGAPKAKLKWLIEAGAWTDAAMALTELELPQRKLFGVSSGMMANGSARYPGSRSFRLDTMKLRKPPMRVSQQQFC